MSLFLLSSCTSEKTTMDTKRVTEFAIHYTAAWCSQNAASVAAHFAENGSLKINAGVRFSGREEWTIGVDGLIQESLGHFDEAEYKRQLQNGVPDRVR
jgi:hypothetical protein